jgi:hypothetical protein
MKTGKLLKFHRPGGDIHAYLYDEGGGRFQASVYVLRGTGGPPPPAVELSGASAEEVEAGIRAWVDAHFPRPPRG